MTQARRSAAEVSVTASYARSRLYRVSRMCSDARLVNAYCDPHEPRNWHGAIHAGILFRSNRQSDSVSSAPVLLSIRVRLQDKLMMLSFCGCKLQMLQQSV